MTRSDYDRLKELSAETKRLKKRLRAGKNGSFVPAVNYSGMGGNASTGDSVSRMVCDWSGMEERIASNTVEMGNIIDTEPDADMRELLWARFVQHKTWLQIACALGDRDKETPRMRLNRHVKKL